MIKVSDFKKDLCIFCSSISAFNNIARKDNTLNLPIRILDNCIRKIDEFDFKDKDLDFISKQFDIKNKIYKEYDSNWKNKGDELLELDLLQVFAGFLFLRVLLAKGNPNEARTLKYINVCWKIFDSIELPDFLQEAKTCLNKIQDELFEHISSKNKYSEKISFNEQLETSFDGNDKFSTLPLNVIFYENPIGRAYLEMLYSLGLKPKKIIHIIPERDIVTKRKIGRFLPLGLRQKYTHSIQSSKISFWPRNLMKKNKLMCDDLFKELEKSLNIKKSSIIGLLEHKSLELFSEEIIPVSYDGFKDKRFFDAIKSTSSEFSLYTGGGIIPKEIFEKASAKLLHIHPGFLPNIRGADCFYWSLILSKRPSASCFIMNSGIDTGDIINAKFLPKLNLSDCTKEINEIMTYRLIYSFVDPWIRAIVLRDTLHKTKNLTEVKSVKQNHSEGNTFHFMHKRMRELVVKSFF